MITLKIHPRCLEQVRHWVALAKGEMSALGIVEKENETLVVPEVFLPKQTCSAANTEMDQEDVARIMLDVEREGKSSQTLRLWLHSHADMKCFWSDTDDTTIEALCNDGFVVSVVVNKAGDLKCRVDLFDPFRHTFHEVRVEPLLPEFNLLEQCKAEIAEKVVEIPDMVIPGRIHRDDLLFEDLFDRDYLELEQRLRDGEITMQEYLAQIDGMEGFV